MGFHQHRRLPSPGPSSPSPARPPQRFVRSHRGAPRAFVTRSKPGQARDPQHLLSTYPSSLRAGQPSSLASLDLDIGYMGCRSWMYEYVHTYFTYRASIMKYPAAGFSTPVRTAIPSMHTLVHIHPSIHPWSHARAARRQPRREMPVSCLANGLAPEGAQPIGSYRAHHASRPRSALANDLRNKRTDRGNAGLLCQPALATATIGPLTTWSMELRMGPAWTPKHLQGCSRRSPQN